MPHLFEPLTVRGVTLKNRIGVSPMCQYSCIDGMPTDWHLVHLASRAVGGAALVMTEATAVEARGRISPSDAGIWSHTHIAPWTRITKAISDFGGVPGIQLAHAGRKASTMAPWDGGKGIPNAARGWEPVAPSTGAFDEDYREPRALGVDEIKMIVTRFGQAARRAREAGFNWIEIHAAHGYLIHEFLSPLTNRRIDEYGGSFENRARFLLEITHEIRRVWRHEKPLAVRISASDWTEGGWSIEDSILLARKLREEGADLVDCSSGGIIPRVKIPVGPGYQVEFAAQIREGAPIPTAAVGMITEPSQADEIIQSGKADLVFMARASLRDPYWPIHAAKELGHEVQPPRQYERAFLQQ